MRKFLPNQRHLWALLLSVFVSWSAQAQTPVDVTVQGVAGKKTENFNGLANTGTTNTVLPAGWAFNETGSGANTSYAADTGSGNAGNTYSYGSASATDRAFGGLQSGSVVPTIGGVYRNATGAVVTDIVIAYVGEQWRLGTTGRADRITFQYSTDATSLTTGTWTNVTALDFASPFTTTVGALDGNLAANRTAITNTITGVNLPNNTNFWIRWQDFNASGADDGLAIDDFEITFGTVPATPPDIAISSPAQVGASNVSQGTTDVVLSAFQLAVTTSAASLTGLTVTTAGGYVAADLTNLKVRYSTDATLDAGDATLSTKTATLGIGTHVFPSFTAQNIAQNATGYIFVTADLAGAATVGNTISLGAIAPADITFASGNKTGSATAGGAKTIIAATAADVALSSPAQVTAGNISQGATNRVLSAFQLAVTTANATLTGLTITTAGTYTATDITNLKLWYQATGTFNAATATLLSTKSTVLGTGTHVFPSFTNQTVNSGNTGFFFVTADVAAAATVNHTINVAAITNADLTFVAANKTGTATAGGTQTIVGTTIGAARGLPLGTVVTLTGTITVAKQFGGTVFMQDATGGIAIFDARTGNPLFNDANLAVGKFLTVTGTLAEFQPTTGVPGSGLLQVSTLTSYTIGAVNPTPIVPKVITGAMTEADEALLVQINNPTFTDRGLFLPARSYRFNYGSVSNAICRTAGTSETNFNLLGSDVPQTVPALIGVQGQFRGTYQFQPRQNADVNNATAYQPSFQTVPTTQTLEVVTFNMLWFGLQSNSNIVPATQLANALATLQSMDADVYMVQEVVDVTLFNNLVASMTGYAGVLSPCVSTSGDPAQSQKVGFIYRTSVIQPDPAVNGGNIVCYLQDYNVTGYPTGNPSQFWASGRFPAMLTVNATLNGVTTRIRLVSLHAKANSTPGSEGYTRRKYDFDAFKQRLDADFPNDRIIIGGDHNEDADFTVASGYTATTPTSFDAFTTSNNFRYVSKTLSDGRWRSYVGDQTDMIDHLAISDELYDEYLPNTTIIPDVYAIPTFLNQNFDGRTISDHLPVVMRVMLHKPVIKVLDNITNIPNNSTTPINYGTTNVGTPVTRTFTINNTGLTDLNLSALTLPTGYSLVGTFPSTVAALGTATFQVRLDATAGGVYNGNVQFTTNDVLATPFVFAITGTVNATGCATITVSPATITNTATVGAAYTTVNYSATGGTAPYTFTVAVGTLPTGMTLTTAGVLSGTPTVAGTYNFTVRATDNSASNCAGIQAYTITVTCPTITVTPATLGNGAVGTAYTTANLSSTGGTAPYTFAVTAGALPAGLTLTAAGVLSGTPTAAGTYNFTVTTTDANNCTATRAYTIDVVCSAGFSITAQPTTVNQCGVGNANFSVTATNATGTLAYRWQEAVGVNPFTDISNGGVYSGATTATLTLTGVGASFDGRSYRCIVTNNGCDLTSNGATLNVNIQAVATFNYAAAAYCSSATNPSPTFTGGGIAGTFSATPAGLVFVSNTTGQINLAASTAGTYTVTNTIAAAGACPAATATFNVTINASPTITLGTVPNVTVGATSFNLPYTATTGTPTQYSITTGTPNAMAGFVAVTNQALTASPIAVTIPNTAPAGVYNFNLTVNTATCTSVTYPFTVVIGTPINNALNFEGAANNYVACTNSALLRPTAAVTLEVWAFRNSWTTGMANTTIAGNTETGGYAIYTRAANEISAGVRRNGTTRFINTPSTGLASGWHHFALTYDGRIMILYIDGVEAVRDDAGATYPIQYSVSNTFIIGAESGASATPAGEYFRGAVDEVRVWNTARTCSQLLSTYKRELQGNEAGLIAYYNFNQGVASGNNAGVTTLNNLTANPLNGTLNAFALTGATSNWVDGSGNGVIIGTPVVQPEVNVQGNSVNIPRGTTATATTNNTDFGSTPISVGVTRTFVIQNTDTGNLNITGITFTGANAADFALVTPPTFPATVTGSSSLTITVRFTPSAAGTRNATINIASNDCDEATYNFALIGTGLTPTITTSVATLTAFTACSGVVSNEQQYTVSGTNLAGNIVITAPTGFEISTTTGAGFATTVTLTPTANTVATTTIFVRQAATAANGASGNIAHVSTSATTVNVAIPTSSTNATSITLGTVQSVLPTATSFTIPYTASTGSPNQYSITTGTPNALAGFVAVTNATLPTSPITVNIPANSAVGSYNFNLTVRNSTTGCVSAVIPFTLVIDNPPPPVRVRASQRITFDCVTERVFTFNQIPLNARASSLLPVTVEVVSGAATLNGQMLTLTGLGAVTLRATQAGNLDFLPAEPVTCTFNVVAATPRILGFDSIPDRAWNSGSFAIRATSDLGLPVTFTVTQGQNIVNINNNLVSMNPAVGRVTITANIAATAGTGAVTLNRSFNVTKANQTILFNAPSVTRPLLTETLTATTTSGLAISYRVVSGNATVTGNQLSITNAAAPIVVEASQAGNDLWNAATAVTRTIQVLKLDQTINLARGLQDVTIGTAQTVAATATSGLTVGVRVISGQATVNGLSITPTGSGLVQVELTQAGNDIYNPAQPVLLAFRSLATITLTSTNVGATFCAGATVTATFTTNGNFADNNAFSVEISNPQGDFVGTTLGSIDAVGGTQTITVRIPAGLTVAGTQYRIRIISSTTSVVSNASTPFVINILPNQPFISLSNDGKSLSSNQTGTHQWFLNGTAIAGATAANFTPTQSGTYTVTVAQNGCVSIGSMPFFYNFVATGVNDPTLSSSLSIYPNPTEGKVVLEGGLEKAGKLNLTLTDALGRVLSNEVVESNGLQFRHELSLSDYASGVYFLQVETNGKSAVKRIVKK